MADRPIIFSAPMVRALLAGRKSMTRRVLKDQPSPNEPTGGASPYGQDWVWQHGMDGSIFRQMLPAPPYAPGDRLWVREAFSYESLDVDRNGFMPPWYWADGNPESGDFTRPKPSIHMPRWASRLTLLVTDVRVQRLQEISEDDAKAEGADDGFRQIVAPGNCPEPRCDGVHYGPLWHFRHIWNSIHGPDAWDANPWVAAISFTAHRCNIDTMEEGTW